MAAKLTDIKYSILDLAVISEGQSPGEAIRNSRDVAIHAEDLGYTRFWMAEHHNMRNIASSATSVLIGYMAEATKTLRIGSGGIMLPNHSPLMVAEQFGTLASLYPDRIDLGLGRAPGTDQSTAREIRPDRMMQVRHFPENIQKLQRYFSDETDAADIRAVPGEGTNVPLWILGSSTDSAHLAAVLGLPYVFASHFAPQQLAPALQIYRDGFRPSDQLQKPYVMPCINVVAAASDDKAQWLATSLKQMMMGIVTGKRDLLQPPVEDMNEVWNFHQKAAVEQMLSRSLIGGKETITEGLQAFLDETKADEIMVISHLYDHEASLDSYRIFAEIMKER